jgi:hypothetical protein
MTAAIEVEALILLSRIASVKACCVVFISEDSRDYCRLNIDLVLSQ